MGAMKNQLIREEDGPNQRLRTENALLRTRLRRRMARSPLPTWEDMRWAAENTHAYGDEDAPEMDAH